MGTSRTGAAGAAARIQVSRTGRPRRRLGWGVAPLRRASSPRRGRSSATASPRSSGCRRDSVDLVFADPPYNLQLDRRPARGRTRASSTPSTTPGTSSRASPTTTPSPAPGSLACRRVMKTNATLWVIGSYHNIFRVGATLQDLGFWILNDIVWRKANPMPNFRGRRFTNAHETLIWAAQGRRRQGLHLPLRGAEGRQRRPPDALRLVLPALHRRGAPEGRGRPQGPSDPEARGAARARAARRVASPATWSSIPFFGTGTTGAVAKRLGRRFIGIERDRDLCRGGAAAHRRGRAARPRGARARAGEARRAARAVPRRWSRAGSSAPARRSSTSAAATGARARRRHARARPGDRLDPQDRRARPGAAGLQRLDLLARRARRRSRRDRRLPRDRARRHGHGLIWSAAARRNVSPSRELPPQDSCEGRRQ